MKVAIDFGTCNSVPEILVGRQIFDLEGATGIPTLFLHNKESGTDHFGTDCENQPYAQDHRADIVRYIKTLVRNQPHRINTPGTILSGGASYSYRDVVKLFLEYVVGRAREQVNKMGFAETPLEGICVTAPATAGAQQMLSTEYRDMLIGVLAEVTGLARSRIHVLSEPVAAALHYLSNQEKEETVLVFDLGGATLDITIMTYSSKNGKPHFEEKRIGGDPSLGGCQWDEALSSFILKELDLDPSNPGFLDAAEEVMFNDAIVRMKHDLTERPHTVGGFYLNKEFQSVAITREKFDEITADLRKRAMDVLKKLALSYNGNIDKIVLVGGSCNMPQIREAIEKTFAVSFQKDQIFLHEPSKAIAKGAATYLKWESLPVPTPIVRIAEASYGWDSLNSIKQPPRNMVYLSLMKGTHFKNGVIDQKSEDVFRAVDDDQEEVTFTLYEACIGSEDCEGGHWIDFGPGQRLCGIVVTVPIPEEYRGCARSYSLTPTLRLDENGVLTISVYDEEGTLLASHQEVVR